jgi:hypothetical protein
MIQSLKKQNVKSPHAKKILNPNSRIPPQIGLLHTLIFGSVPLARMEMVAPCFIHSMTWLQSVVTGSGGPAAMRGPLPEPQVASHHDSTSYPANFSVVFKLIFARKSSNNACRKRTGVNQRQRGDWRGLSRGESRHKDLRFYLCCRRRGADHEAIGLREMAVFLSESKQVLPPYVT